MTLSRLVLVLASLLENRATAAQAFPYVGARVRVFMRATPQVAVGYFIEADRDSVALELRPSHETVRFGWEEIARGELSSGIRRHTLPGAGIGFAVGALLGVAAGANGVGEVSGSAAAPIFGLGFGLLGGLLGAVIGDVIRTEKWRPIANWPTGGGAPLQVGIRLRLRFLQ